MKTTLLILLISSLTLHAIEIISKPITFDSQRIALTKQYILNHYNRTPNDITIIPKMIVIHYTAVATLKASFNRFKGVTLPNDRGDIATASALNVSAHFLVDSDGTIYQLMPENIMARHVIGLNYSSIGIENIAKDSSKLTSKQLEANVALVRYLQHRYSTIKYVIGHSEYREFENHKLWLENDKNYRTIKSDPGKLFMKSLREKLQNDK